MSGAAVSHTLPKLRPRKFHLITTSKPDGERSELLIVASRSPKVVAHGFCDNTVYKDISPKCNFVFKFVLARSAFAACGCLNYCKQLSVPFSSPFHGEFGIFLRLLRQYRRICFVRLDWSRSGWKWLTCFTWDSVFIEFSTVADCSVDLFHLDFLFYYVSAHKLSFFQRFEEGTFKKEEFVLEYWTMII